MKLTYDQTHLDLQGKVHAFLEGHWKVDRARDPAFVKEFRTKAVERGYLYRGIPRKYGGSEQAPDVVAAKIINEAFTAARAPQEVPGIGMMMLVPVLLECGTDWQKEKFVAKTVSGEYKWAQGYSEPGSGSDLASLRTRGELRDGEWIINGHKIWTTRAHEANFMFALVRTEPQASKHAGLSYLLLDFKQPGITVKPIRQISGEKEFSEVFLDDVRTPADWIVGERGNGWQISKVNLKHERSAVGAAGRAQALFRSLLKLAKSRQIDGKRAIDHPLFRDRIAAVEGYVNAQLYAGYHLTTLAVEGQTAGTLGLVSKLNNTNIGQLIAGIATDICDRTLLIMPSDTGKVGDERWFKQVMGSLGLSIAGGASNIQRNIIAERGLGLPRSGSDV
jgi:alkylation response protein AidB-like acyl-CoA dehydrogenase